MTQKNTQKLENKTRKSIATFLPEAIKTTLNSYHEFSSGIVPDDAKGFSAHHSACKVAIAHIELLIKLARWADLPDKTIEDEAENDILAQMINSAQAELEEYNNKNLT